VYPFSLKKALILAPVAALFLAPLVVSAVFISLYNSPYLLLIALAGYIVDVVLVLPSIFTSVLPLYASVKSPLSFLTPCSIEYSSILFLPSNDFTAY